MIREGQRISKVGMGSPQYKDCAMLSPSYIANIILRPTPPESYGTGTSKLRAI